MLPLSSSLQKLHDLQSPAPPYTVPFLVSCFLYALLAHALLGLYNHQWQVPGLALRLLSAVGIAAAKYAARKFKPLFPEWTLSMEILVAFSRCVYSNYGDRVVTPKNAEILRVRMEVAGNSWIAGVVRKYGTAVERFEFNGLEHLWVREATRSLQVSAPRVVVLYFHGGGYVSSAPSNYVDMASQLLTRITKRLRRKLGHDVQVDVLLGNYRKAPQFPYPRPPQDCHAVYNHLVGTEKVPQSYHRIPPRRFRVIVTGDSAGGGLTMATLLRARDQDPTMLPLAAMLSYPFLDMEVKCDERKTPYCLLGDKGAKGFWDAYYPERGDPSTWGDASPVHCDLSGLPPVYIQAAELDYLLPHSLQLMKKALADGQTNWELDIFPNVPHGFTALPENISLAAGKGLDALCEYAAEQFARSLNNSPMD